MDERVSGGVGCQRGAQGKSHQEVRGEPGGKEKLRQPRKQRARRYKRKDATAKWFMILRMPAEDGNTDHRHAGMDCRHPSSQDAAGDIHVGLGSSTPCWNDATERFCLN